MIWILGVDNSLKKDNNIAKLKIELENLDCQSNNKSEQSDNLMTLKIIKKVD